MITRNRFTGAILCAFLNGLLFAQSPAVSLKTPGEASGYSRYTQHGEVARFLADASRGSREVKVPIIGRSLAGKELPAVDLRLCVLTEEGVDNPAKLNRKKITFLIFASQHGNEQSGKEAALRLIRDLAFGDLQPLLKKVNVLVVPQSNPYGNSIDRRPNEQNLDLNRDHVKLEASETRAIHRVFHAWMPEVTLDVHEKGDDYYRVSTGCVSNLNIHESLQRFSREQVFPIVEKKIAGDGFTWHEYLVSDIVGSASAAGVPDRPGDRGTRETLMRYSTTDLNDGRNSLGIFETLSFIQEGASRHDLQSLEARTRWQYSGIRALLEVVADKGSEIHSLVAANRSRLLQRARAAGTEDRIHLRMEYVRDSKEPEIRLMRFDRSSPGSGPPPTEPKVVTEIVKNWYPKVESRFAIHRTAGYLIPAAQGEVVKNLLDHGIRVGVLSKEAILDIESYRVTDITPAKEDYVAPERIEVEIQPARITAKKGDYYVSCDQPAADLISCLLEPQSEYGLVRYRAYALIPAKGGTFPISRVAKGHRPPTIPVSPRP